MVRAMREAILDGTLAPGENLSERRLLQMFGVSRGLVREAIKALAAEELITLVPHRGPTVSRLDRHAARELYRVRAALEGLACADFTRNADTQHHAELQRINTRLHELPENAASDELISVKNEFYRCLMNGARNRVLAQMFTQLNNRITQLRRFTLSRPGRLTTTRAEINAIVTAIAQGDADEARHLAEAHVASAASAADARFDEIENVNTDAKGT
nr:GntR family transcriptional regulator [Pseudohoeflea sp. DP4N28-3]